MASIHAYSGRLRAWVETEQLGVLEIEVDNCILDSRTPFYPYDVPVDGRTETMIELSGRVICLHATRPVKVSLDPLRGEATFADGKTPPRRLVRIAKKAP